MNSVFVSFPFDPRFDAAFNTIAAACSNRGFSAIRVDQGSPIARSITATIQSEIRSCRLVVADVTGSNPNVLNEIGQAQALGKPLVIISQDRPSGAPFNVRDLPVNQYSPSQLGALRSIVETALVESTSPSELLRSMLVPGSLGRPTRDSWYVIAASPLSYRRARGRAGGYRMLRRTSSDYVGIRGILQGFGLLYGFEVLPDNLDPEDCDDLVLDQRMNLYSIASSKANRWTGRILSKMADEWSPALAFRADSGSEDLRNVRVSIVADGALLQPSGWDSQAPRDGYARDFGLIVRSPKPQHPDNMVVVIAGRSSLGTEAAALAYTEPTSIDEIRRRLLGVDVNIDDHRSPFWVLVSMRRQMDSPTQEADRASLRIERVEAFGPRLRDA